MSRVTPGSAARLQTEVAFSREYTLSTFLRISLPLAFVNFLNQAARTILAVIGPLIALEFGLTAQQLGLLAASMFAAYGLAQLPVGLALDLFGARRVQTVLASVAMVGLLLFAMAGSYEGLILARALTGIGVSAGLIAMLKANSQWYRPDQVAGVTGWCLVVGALGGVVVTVPVEFALPVLGWRGVYFVLAGLAVLIAAAIWIRVPDRPPGVAHPAQRSLREEIGVFGEVFRHPAFIRFVPAVILLTVMNFTYQGLWAGPWLRDVGGVGDTGRASLLLVYALALTVGAPVMGMLTSLTQRHGLPPLAVPWACAGALIVIQLLLMTGPTDPAVLGVLWFLFPFFTAAGPSGYAVITQHFPLAYVGRVSTAINVTMLLSVFLLQSTIGAILDLWPRTATGGWDAAAYGWALGLTVALQIATGLWAILRR